MKRRSLLSLAALIAASLGTMSASAAVLVNDTWQDGERASPAAPTYSEMGVDADADGDLESAWFNGGASTMTATAGNLNLDLTGSSANWTTYFTPEGSEVNLANDGDKLTVTWVFTLTGVAADNTSQNFRFGVFNSPAAARLVADGTPPTGAYTGYSVFANMGGTLGNSNPFQLREIAVASTTTAILGAASDFSTLGNGATTGNDGFDAGTPYTVEWALTRNGAGLDVAVSLSGTGYNNTGTGSVSVNDPDGNGFAFDTFNVRPSSAAGVAEAFDTKSFRVEFTPGIIPEPTSVTLAGLGGLLALSQRRRR